MSPSRRCLSATWGGHLPAQPGRAALSMRKSCAKGSAPHRKIDRPGKIPDRKREVGSGRKHVRMGKMQPTWPIPPTRCFIPHQLLQAGAPRSRTGATGVPPATDDRGTKATGRFPPSRRKPLPPACSARFQRHFRPAQGSGTALAASSTPNRASRHRQAAVRRQNEEQSPHGPRGPLAGVHL